MFTMNCQSIYSKFFDEFFDIIQQSIELFSILFCCREQRAEMEKHVAEYAQHYPLKQFDSKNSV